MGSSGVLLILWFPLWKLVLGESFSERAPSLLVGRLVQEKGDPGAGDGVGTATQSDT